MKKAVVLVYRKQFAHTYSIEFIFDQLSKSLRPSQNISKFTLPRFSNSAFNRVVNIFVMLRLWHKIVHVTGDVHYAILGTWFSKRILTIHDLAFMYQNKGIKRSILKWFWIVLPVRFANRITTVSEATKLDILNYVEVDPRKIKVIPNFIAEIFQPVFNRKFNHHPQILQIGTAFNKNIERLAEALFDIPCTLTVIGNLDGSQQSVLENFRINYNNKVGLTEQQLFQEYAEADLLTFISTIEGFGMPILEAQACGLPVITSNCSAMPEVAGDAAIFVDPFDIKSIKNGIISLMENECLQEQLIKKGFENVKRFSKEKVVAQYTLLYQELQT